MALKQLTHAPTGRMFTETGTWRIPQRGEWFASKLTGGPVKMLAAPGERCWPRHILRELPVLEAIEGRQHSTRRGDTFEETGEIRAPQLGDNYLGKFGDQHWPATCTRAGDPADDGAGVDRIILRKIERPEPFKVETKPEPWISFDAASESHIFARIGDKVWATETGPETRARNAEAVADAALERCAELEAELAESDRCRWANARAALRYRTDWLNAEGERHAAGRDRDEARAERECAREATLRARRIAIDRVKDARRSRENAQVIAGELWRTVLAYEQAQAGRVEAESRVWELEGELDDAEDAPTEGVRDDLAAGGLL
jgi:hypothetical protein